MNVATVAYLPPDHIPFASAFRENIRQFKTNYPVILFSDRPDRADMETIVSPEKFNRPGKKWVISNYCFLKAIQVAVKRGLDWMILLEADCRVNGDNWDQKITTEFSQFGEAVMGGTPVCWNLNRGGRTLTMRVIDYASEYQKRAGIPMALHGVHGGLTGNSQPTTYQQPCLYPNGAAAIYSVELLRRAFPNYTDDSWSTQITAWDMHLGYQMHNFYGDDVTKRVAALAAVFSGYGDEILSAQERRDWLTSGKICAVHQIKDGWKP